MSDIDERIVREEELTLRKSAMTRIKGTLTLTPAQLVFSTEKGLFHKQSKQVFAIRVADILNVRAKKAFAAGEDHLEIDYISDGKKEKVLLSRFSLAQWASTATSVGRGGGAMGRLEGNSLSAWEEAISDARHQDASPNLQNSMASEVDALERLAGLKDKGIITEEEFQQKKKQILGL